MIKKIGCLIFAFIFIVGIQSTFFTSRAYAQGNTKVALATDKSYYNVGDTVKVTVQAQNVVDLFGVQFTLHYDPNMLSMEGDNLTFSDGYTVFGGSTVDKENGTLTYPVINKKPSSDKKDSVTIGYANFKATKEGPITLNMDNIKSVNSQSLENNYNTQTQAVFNVTKAPSNSGNNPGSNDDNSINGGNNVNSAGNANQGSGNNATGNSVQGSGNTNQAGNSNNNNGGSHSSATSFNSDSTSSSISGDSGSSSSESDGSANTNSNADGIIASAGSNANQEGNESTSTVSQSENGNSTNQNTASNNTKNSEEGSSQSSSKNDTTKKQTLNSKSNSNLNIILPIVLVVVVIACGVLAFFNRKVLKNVFFKIMKRKN
ncbi:cohesin domain-containing protein [Clostridium arbusti]|uniref:cohesin domain-containing protein n=1 Tax=Clostridium arbusti TaxID=1137848 RepID=UPI000288067A|nr:cohesin domain-containing protein [Clostridium arbusti]